MGDLEKSWKRQRVSHLNTHREPLLCNKVAANASYKLFPVQLLSYCLGSHDI